MKYNPIEIIFFGFIGILILALLVILACVYLSPGKELDTYCKEKGYEEQQYSNIESAQAYCYNITNGTITKYYVETTFWDQVKE